MAAYGFVCSFLLFTFLDFSQGTQCRRDANVELSANTQSKFIYSPNYPEQYPAFSVCKWRIRIESQSRNKRIQIRTVDVGLPIDHDNCTSSTIKAFDGQHNTAPLIKEWCDDSTIFSTGPYVIVEFHSGHIPSKGFALAFHEVNIFSHKCKAGEVQKIDVTQTPFVISLPDEDAFNNGNVNCEWLFISGKSDSKITVEIDEWIIDSPADFCNNSYISFHDGNSSKSLEILNYCHQDPPFHRLVSSFELLFVRLHGVWRNPNTNLPIITLKLHSQKIINPRIDCHSNFQTTVVGSVPSFIVYPTGDIETVQDNPCPIQLWSSDRSQTVRVDVVGSSGDDVTCEDFIHAFTETKEDTIPTTCINNNPSYNNPHNIRINNITRPGVDKVVLRAYTVDFPCNGETDEQWAENDKKKSLMLLDGQKAYINNGYCKYLLRAEQDDDRIKLFVNGSFYGKDAIDEDCDRDFLALYDGRDEKAPMITKWCGGFVPDGFHSTGQNMLVIFRSDRQGRQLKDNYNVQYIAYKELCSRFPIPLNATLTPKNLTSPGYPDYYAPESVCNWSIRPSSDSYTIVFQVVHTRLGPHCKSMLSAYDHADDESNSREILGRACESETPIIRSKRGEMNVEFRSDKLWNVGGFLAQYWEEPIPEPESERRETGETEHIGAGAILDNNNNNNNHNNSDRLKTIHLVIYILLTLLHSLST